MTDFESAGRTVIGRIDGAFGLRGEVKVSTSDPSDFSPGLRVVAALDASRAVRADRELTIASLRSHQERLLVRFEGIIDATDAQALQGSRLWARVDDLPPLPSGSYRDADLVGMRVVDARLGALGEVTSIAHYPHADMLVVGARGLLVPMLEAYDVKIERDDATISTRLPDGFEDL